jgi:hypothetical protein
LYEDATPALARLASGTQYNNLQMGATLPSWSASSTSVLTTTGDLLYASGANTLARLAGGTSGDVLTANGAGVAPSYQTPAGGGGAMELISTTTTGAVGNFTITFSPAITLSTVSKIVGVVNCEKGASSTIYLKYNAVGTSTYNNTVMQQTTASVGGYVNSGRSYGWDLISMGTTAEMFGTFELTCNSVSGNMQLVSNFAVEGGQFRGSGYNTTTGVTTLSSLYFEASGSTFSSGSTFDMYKVNR